MSDQDFDGLVAELSAHVAQGRALILKLAALGYDERGIAAYLEVSVTTVRRYLRRQR